MLAISSANVLSSVELPHKTKAVLAWTKAFFAAFTQRKQLSEGEIAEIRRMIDSYTGEWHDSFIY